jgi:hypothetical protein
VSFSTDSANNSVAECGSCTNGRVSGKKHIYLHKLLNKYMVYIYSVSYSGASGVILNKI